MAIENVNEIRSFCIQITGLVQGVGFRPFIYRLAREFELKGSVENRNDGVIIYVNCSPEVLHDFIRKILDTAPPSSNIDNLSHSEIIYRKLPDFSIKRSENVSDSVTEISPDIAVCPECLSDMQNQSNRINYPFVNCTSCGPRFSIIKDLPYDRPNTTMASFVLCPDCRAEYDEVNDRRFHAQPLACVRCGPELTLLEKGKEIRGTDRIFHNLGEGLGVGQVYLVKGMGGFHLMCDAFKESAVNKIRQIKQRDGKPFALMFRSIEEARKYVSIEETEEKLLTSWQRPIILLKMIQPVCSGIADGLDKLGIMLPYMPFHYLLFENIKAKGIVLTSGNISDEPIVIDNDEAVSTFSGKVDGIITYNREIHNRSDDSLMAVINKQEQVLRRSRGYAPSPIRTHVNVEGIFGAGAELMSSFCMGKNKNAMMSQYIGDLKNFETLDFYKESYHRYSKMFRFTPEIIVHDLHPDYLSTKFSRELSGTDSAIQLLGVQHHHAHIASTMMSCGLEGEVIGLSFDGLGLGDDGNLWGAEVMLASYKEYTRLFHFEYMPLPGGDRANKEPWRMAIAYLHHCFGEEMHEFDLPLFKSIKAEDIRMLQQMIEKKLNTPMISSAGRLFDAVSAILGLNFWASYQAEAPMLLESAADQNIEEKYTFELSGKAVSFSPMIKEIVRDKIEKKNTGYISAKFHNTLAFLGLQLASQIRDEYQLKRVVLSGGTFQNRYLTKKLISLLSASSFEVFLPGKVPVNDQGIALGQLAIGAAHFK